VLVVVLAVVAGLAAWQLATRRAAPASIAGIPAPVPPDAPPPPISRVQSLVSATTSALSNAADAGLRAIGLVPPLAEPDDTAAPAPTVRAARPPQPVDAAPEPVPPSVIADTPPPALPVEENPPVPPAMPAREPIVERLEPFTAADTEVEPPVLVYPQLRTGPEPGAPPPGTPYFDLLVNEAGLVEEVRLRGPAPSMQERMMVSAVKAWRFRPAMKDGEPVRYRVRLPIPR